MYCNDLCLTVNSELYIFNAHLIKVWLINEFFFFFSFFPLNTLYEHCIFLLFRLISFLSKYISLHQSLTVMFISLYPSFILLFLRFSVSLSLSFNSLSLSLNIHTLVLLSASYSLLSIIYSIVWNCIFQLQAIFKDSLTVLAINQD